MFTNIGGFDYCKFMLATLIKWIKMNQLECSIYQHLFKIFTYIIQMGPEWNHSVTVWYIIGYLFNINPKI